MKIKKIVEFFIEKIIRNNKQLLNLNIPQTSREILFNFNFLYPKVKRYIYNERESYYLFFLIHKELLPYFESLFNFEYVSEKLIELDLSKTFGFDLKIRIIDDFGGYIIEIETTSKQMVEGILNKRTYPPSPEISFPKLNPEEYYGSLQGNIDFWFNQLWEPYWKSLSKEDKTSLPLTESWRELIMFKFGE
ncbi:hypothetical protein SAMN02583745_02869 [Thorsellia anophelis DSM 18579]|uniref:Uncharacterized protein n=2 Tax=Thorsellia anophelis TaxID=336804 RepID=A0A1I0FTV5_9GAMM|nr:hypothetical protein SAMN02583745_02869 [Thorsellia anophelis DSM 18579]